MESSDSNGECLRLLRFVLAVLCGCAVLGGFGCTTVAEHRKLERRVIDIERGGTRSGGMREQVAEYVADIDSIREEIRTLEGRLELAERAAAQAQQDSMKARADLARLQAGQPVGDSADGAATEGPPGSTVAAASAEIGATGAVAQDDLSEEIRAYRDAHAAWRSDENEVCVDRFRKFLQTYPASPYADDAAFWMADCHFKQSDFKNAVLRFDDVVRNYPSGNRAPDALFRQGESLLKLGPGFREAAKRAFERVIKEYPDSARAEDARKQLEMTGAG